VELHQVQKSEAPAEVSSSARFRAPSPSRGEARREDARAKAKNFSESLHNLARPNDGVYGRGRDRIFS
jgi:hypothetical protein